MHASVYNPLNANTVCSVEVHAFGYLDSGERVERITLDNKQGTIVELLNYGASIHRIRTPDKHGNCDDIVLHCETLSDYINQSAYLGSTVGRYANRIRNGRFKIGNQTFQLTTNESGNHLHGGKSGFDRKIWDLRYGCDEDSCFAHFQLTSPAGDQGYPGTLTTDLQYRLDRHNRLTITVSAMTTESTIVNISSHAYFNLSGTINKKLHHHKFEIPSGYVTDIDHNGIPTGSFLDVKDSALDLSSAREISSQLTVRPAELQFTQGFDHNYVFHSHTEPQHRATVHHEPSGRTLKVFATQPGLQFYTGNYLHQCDVNLPGNIAAKAHTAFCLEPQYFPDAPNHPYFSSPVLHPEQVWREKMVYEFSSENQTLEN